MDVKKLSGKKVKSGIKNGMTIQDFCQKYECTPDELWARVGRIFTVKDTARHVWNQIEANGKKKRKSKVKERDNAAEANVETETMEVTECVAEDETKGDISSTPTLDELKASERNYSDATIKLERAYKDLHAERERGRETYQRLRNEARELKKEHDAKRREAEKIAQRDNELVSQMNEISAAHGFKQAALEKIRAQIKEMSKIVLCVYSSREIAPFDEAVEINLDDTGHDELFSQLREQEEAEDFRPKDLRLVARVIRIVANLDVKVEILFDDEEIKKAYEVFVKSA